MHRRCEKDRNLWRWRDQSPKTGYVHLIHSQLASLATLWRNRYIGRRYNPHLFLLFLHHLSGRYFLARFDFLNAVCYLDDLLILGVLETFTLIVTVATLLLVNRRHHQVCELSFVARRNLDGVLLTLLDGCFLLLFVLFVPAIQGVANIEEAGESSKRCEDS